ncbi:MAG: PhoU domain-containing protein [Candidatus Poseidoniaceae archaeon]
MGAQDNEFRKLQVTGGSTIIVSLPKDWVKSNDLKKGDVVSLEELSSGDLRISPMQGPALKQSITIDCCDFETGLADLMIGSYLSGADVISITCNGPIPRKTRANIRDFLRDTRGMEIEHDDDKEIRIVSILNPSELKLQVSINRMYLLIASLVNDALEVISGEDIELLSDIEDRERQIDARRLLLERQVAASLQIPSVEKRLGVDRFTAMEHANIARVLERMGDHATRLAMLVRENSKLIKIKSTDLPLNAIPLWAKELKTIVHNMYTRDVALIHSAKLNLSKLRDEVEAAEGDMWTGRASAERLLSEFRLSESVRRLCAYGVNFAEALLNMLMHDRLEKV